MTSLFDILIARPKASLLVVLVVTAVIGAGSVRLSIDFSPEQVYVGQDREVEFSEQHKKLFRFEDSIVLVLLEAVSETGNDVPDVNTPDTASATATAS
ncbi:MAG: hypothetical protein KDA89_03390, partial [Planctomycetaceae bacterium]|nr:hypothetical protein [Planctomycetaceae bacterium]